MASLRVFVSHSSKDNTWCDGFVAELKNNGLDVWYDREGLYVGAQWVLTIEQELQRRDIFLIVLTPDALASQWVQRERSLALAHNKQIIGVLHKPTQADSLGFLAIYQQLDVTRLDGKQAAQFVIRALSPIQLQPGVNPQPFKPQQIQQPGPSRHFRDLTSAEKAVLAEIDQAIASATGEKREDLIMDKIDFLKQYQCWDDVIALYNREIANATGEKREDLIMDKIDFLKQLQRWDDVTALYDREIANATGERKEDLIMDKIDFLKHHRS